MNTHWTIGCGLTVVARTRTSADGNRWQASAAEAVADTRPSPVPIPRASVASVPCDGGWQRAAAACCDGGAGPAPPGPSLRPNGSRPMVSRSTRRTLSRGTHGHIVIIPNEPLPADISAVQNRNVCNCQLNRLTVIIIGVKSSVEISLSCSK